MNACLLVCSKVRSAACLTVLIVIGAGAVATQAPADFLPFTDGFENIAVGDYPDENGWQVVFSGQSAYVTDQEARTGEKSFRLAGASGWCRQDCIYVGEPPDVTVYEASFFVPAGTQTGTAAHIGFVQKTSPIEGPAWNAFFMESTGGNQVTFGTWLEHDLVLGTFTPGQWCTVKAELNFVNLLAKLWLDGGLTATDVPIKPRQWVDPASGWALTTDKFGMSPGLWPTTPVYYDDMSVTPEPAAIVLLLGAGLALTRRRRMKRTGRFRS